MRYYHVVRSIILIGLIFSFIQEAQGYPTANFQTQGSEWVRSDNDSLFSGIHLAQYTYSVSVFNLKDDSHTVLGNITYTLDGDNIVDMDDEEYAQRNGSFIHWVYPTDRVIVEDDWIHTGVKSGYYYSKYVPMNINRWTNKSIFNSDGFQLAKFNVTFENSTYDFIWGGIQAEEHTIANATFNATILLDTFSTDAPITKFDKQTEHQIQFNLLNKSLVETNRAYNFSVVIKLNLAKNNDTTISAIEYKPYFAISYGKQNGHSAGGANFTATMPADMLPEHVHYASASTNVSNTWSYSSTLLSGMKFNEIINVVNATTPTPTANVSISGFSFQPQTINVSAGTTVTWTNLDSVAHTVTSDTGLFDSSSLSTGQTFSRTFNTAGNYDYHCSIHPSMTGRVAVSSPTTAGTDTVGVYNNAGTWALWNSTSNAADIVGFGFTNTIPVVGDWNGDGKTDVGVYNKGGNNFLLRNGTSLGIIGLGWSGVTPVVGDWNGDDRDEVGVYNNAGTWALWNSTTSAADIVGFGWANTTPVVGDWNGDGTTEVGIYNKGGNNFLLKTASGFDVIGLGWSSVTPVAGDWNSDGRDEVGVYDNAGTWALWNSTTRSADIVGFGWADTAPVVGDWNGDGKTDVGIYNNGGNNFFIKTDSGATAIGLGWEGVTLVVGRWN